jgi:hypothetical protein
VSALTPLLLALSLCPLHSTTPPARALPPRPSPPFLLHAAAHRSALTHLRSSSPISTRLLSCCSRSSLKISRLSCISHFRARQASPSLSEICPRRFPIRHPLITVYLNLSTLSTPSTPSRLFSRPVLSASLLQHHHIGATHYSPLSRPLIILRENTTHSPLHLDHPRPIVESSWPTVLSDLLTRTRDSRRSCLTTTTTTHYGLLQQAVCISENHSWRQTGSHSCTPRACACVRFRRRIQSTNSS